MTNESFTTLGLSFQSDYQQWVSSCNTGGSEGYVALLQRASALEKSMIRLQDTVELALLEQTLADFFSTGFIPNDLNSSGWAEQSPVSQPAPPMARQKPTVKNAAESNWAVPQQPTSNAPISPPLDTAKEVGGNTLFNNGSGSIESKMIPPDPDESKQANSLNDHLTTKKVPANTHTEVDRNAPKSVMPGFSSEPVSDDAPEYWQPPKEMLRERSQDHTARTTTEKNAQKLPFIQKNPSKTPVEPAFQPVHRFSDWANHVKIGQAPNEPEEVYGAKDRPEPATTDISGYQDRTIRTSTPVSARTMRENAETRHFSVETERSPTFVENKGQFVPIHEYPALETTALPPAINNAPVESPLNNPIQQLLCPEDILEALTKTLKEDYRRYYGYL